MLWKLKEDFILMGANLEKQVYIYSVGTSALFNDKEYTLYKRSLKIHRIKKLWENTRYKKYADECLSSLKKQLSDAINQNEDTRHIREDELKDSNKISSFDSFLTRTIGMKAKKYKKNEIVKVSRSIIVIEVFHNRVLKDIIDNGFLMNGVERYVYLTSSAGQMKTKKCVFIKESLLKRFGNTLTCGLSKEDINKKELCNINKYLAYLALTNSASVEWEGFDIDKCIVVPDLETNVKANIDFIDRDTYLIKRKENEPIPIEHTDGCGMMLSSVSEKSFMCRLPWLKGLLVPMDFKKFALENNSTKVTDIYGDEWDIVKDDVQIIFTKSQLKMAKYYDNWDDYKERFKKYNCKAAKLNEEEEFFHDATLTYQMLQTLTDISDEELLELASLTNKDILSIGSDKETMLRVLGATEENTKRNYYQEALFLCNELLNDEFTRQSLKDKKKSMIKDANAGKLRTNGKYTFLIPDLYAFCEKLFLKIDQPEGLLQNNEVYCALFEEGKVDVLRSPHLYIEHAIRNNVKDEKKKDWFITNGIYTSVHDPMSKLLQFDNDGDKALVSQSSTLISAAERSIKKFDIVPLYYEMAKAEGQIINEENIYNSLVLAFKSQIGTYSNTISKLYNRPDFNENDLKVIKWLVMENNFVIDYSKTLFKTSRPPWVKEIISQYLKKKNEKASEEKKDVFDKVKVPYFFTYVKDKEENDVEPINDSTVNRLANWVKNKRITFRYIEEFDYTLLMENKHVDADEDIIAEYIKLDRKKKSHIKKLKEKSDYRNLNIYVHIRQKLLKVNPNKDVYEIVDILVKHLYGRKSSAYKKTLWKAFGDILVGNLTSNIKAINHKNNNTKDCATEDCETAIERKRGKKYCTECAKKREEARLANRRNQPKIKVVI